MLHRNGVRDVLTLDANVPSRPSRIHTENVDPGSDNFDSGLMSYDGAGNLKAVGGSFYAYDEAGRVAASDVASNLGGRRQEEYFYDAFGNVIIDDDSYPGPAPIDPSTNRLVEGPWTDYDDAGNLLTHTDPSFPRWVWRYNALNKVTVQNADQYAYDGFGERIVSFNASGWQFHLRDPADRRLRSFWLTDDGEWSLDEDFIYGGGRRVASTELDFHHDHLENVRLVTDAGGEARDTFTFKPYGVEINHDPWAESNPYTDNLFTGHERDWSTGADYMHARHYQKRLGRFTSVDPLRGSPGEPQSLNRYAYTIGNPLNYTDPTGLLNRKCSPDFWDGQCEQEDNPGLRVFWDPGPLELLDDGFGGPRMRFPEGLPRLEPTEPKYTPVIPPADPMMNIKPTKDLQEQPHLHSPESFQACQRASHAIVSHGTSVWDALGFAIMNLLGGAEIYGVPMILADERTAARALGFTALGNLLTRRSVAKGFRLSKSLPLGPTVFNGTARGANPRPPAAQTQALRPASRSSNPSHPTGLYDSNNGQFVSPKDIHPCQIVY
jgi:RHS repeat-associated protein